jgi:hypothetical protein
MPSTSIKVSEILERRRLLPLRRYPSSRIATNGNVEPSHGYRELRADDFEPKARLGAVVVIARVTSPVLDVGSGETLQLDSGGKPEQGFEPKDTGLVPD